MEPPLTDSRRFDQLVMPHLDAGYNLARWLTRDARDADDVVQEACVRALKYLDSLTGTNARAWFMTIVRNAFYDWLARNRPSEVVNDDNEAVDAAVDLDAPTPEESAVRSDQRRVLAAAIEALPLPYREAFVLREIEELSYKEIARVADIPVGTVMSRLARARGLLRRSPLLHTLGAAHLGAHDEMH
jgi:RNA polymerase sigma-70 factor, ECF subfamily